MGDLFFPRREHASLLYTLQFVGSKLDELSAICCLELSESSPAGKRVSQRQSMKKQDPGINSVIISPPEITIVR